jgi:hypothetical protein
MGRDRIVDFETRPRAYVGLCLLCVLAIPTGWSEAFPIRAAARQGKSAVLFTLLLGLSLIRSSAQVRPVLSPAQMVNQMVKAETAARENRQHFLYRRAEKSVRTRGHLWDEMVVETAEGRMHRLIAVDGKPLSSGEQAAEDKRIVYLVNHPSEFRREAQGRKDDEARMADLLRELPRLFLLQTAGSDGECARITFAPNPQFQEASFQDRVIHAMSGVLLIHTADKRLCGIDAHLEHGVEFGFGLLGKVSDQSHFSIVRQEVLPGEWKTTKIRVHVDGSILLMKSVSRDEDSSHFGFKLMPSDLTLAQAAAMVRSTTF